MYEIYFKASIRQCVDIKCMQGLDEWTSEIIHPTKPIVQLIQLEPTIKMANYMIKLIRNFSFFCCVILVFSQCKEDEPVVPEIEYKAGLQLEELTWEERVRSYQVFAPDEKFANERLPILFVLHGGGGTATELQFSTRNRFNELADQHGFIVVYPEGIEKRWNDGRTVKGVATVWDEDIDDVGFIMEIIRLLQQNYRIDDSKMYTTGISNGGFMSSRLLCEKSEVFKAGAIVIATIPVSYFETCMPSNPTSVLVMNGTEDPLVPYDGGEINVLGQTTGMALSTEAYVQFWADQNACNTTPDISMLEDKHEDDTKVEIHAYKSCGSNSKVQLYKIVGGGHTWPGARELLPQVLVGKTSQEIVACDVIWEFFDGL